LKKGIVNDKDLLDPDSNRGVVIRNIQTRTERKDIPPFSFLDLKEARNKLKMQADLLVPNLGKDLSSLILKISEPLIRPNLTFNKDETEERKLKAREKVNPVYFQIRRGETILRPGERVQEEHIYKIKALKKAQEKSHLFAILIGICLFTFLILASLYEFSTKNIRKISLSNKDLIFFCGTLLGIIAFLKIFQTISDILGGEFLSIELQDVNSDPSS